MDGKKFSAFRDDPMYRKLSGGNRAFIAGLSQEFRLSHMDIRMLLTLCCDLEMWEGPELSELWPGTIDEKLKGKQRKQYALQRVYRYYEEKKREKRRYPMDAARNKGPDSSSLHIMVKEDESRILGACPVASEKTRCCNLQTLDAVINCGFGCTYCTIQPFYTQNTIYFQGNLEQKLEALKLDPQKTYHIGTGQSSDSLMWGNKQGLLEGLFSFARSNPNVILELKTKAKLPSFMKEHPVPSNVISTWTVNGPTIIRHEEPGTADWRERIEGAALLASMGSLVGFHFHPMVYYQGWEEEYAMVIEEIMERIDPAQVAMVSLGTVTFIKPVIRQIREMKLRTKMLQMPLTETAGKFSYPEETKLELFRFAYRRFAPWHGRVFFYLCMEATELWKPVFGFDYPSNQAFEGAMKEAYMEKIKSVDRG